MTPETREARARDWLDDYHFDGRPRIEKDKLLDRLRYFHGEPRFDIASELQS